MESTENDTLEENVIDRAGFSNEDEDEDEDASCIEVVGYNCMHRYR